MNRLAHTLDRCRRQGRGAFSVYLPFGHPDMDGSVAMMAAAIEGGADWLELGIPFSDPAADGPVIEAATHRAVEAGVRTGDCLAAAARLRAQHPDVPLVAMTYANLAFQPGWEAFADALAAAGIDGCILPDVPLEESGPVRAALAAAGVTWIPLVTPTTDAERMAAIAATATGFLYVVGSLGITGGADPGPLVEATVARARTASDVPLVVGFGIATPDDVRRVLAAGSDGAIVGSHLVQLIADGADGKAVTARVRQLAAGAREA